MELVTPGIGLIFWMTLSFSILLFILWKFGWKGIVKSINDRNASIENALTAAEKAKDEMKSLQVSNEKLLAEAREESNKILMEAKRIKENTIDEARTKAKIEADKIIAQAKITIENEKKAAITDLKNQVANFSIEIAEKLIQNELSKDEKQKEYLDKWVNEVKFN